MDKRLFQPCFFSSSTNDIYTTRNEQDFSAAVLSYINQVLMEEDHYFHTTTTDSFALEQAQKSFYDLISPPPPPSPSSISDPPPYYAQSLSGTSSFSENYSTSNSTTNHFTPIPPPSYFFLHYSSNSHPIITNTHTPLHQPTTTNFLPTNSTIHPDPPLSVLIKTETDDPQGIHFWDHEEYHLQNASSDIDSELSQSFDKLLLHGNTTNHHHHKSNNRRQQRQRNYDQIVDLRTLLMLCSQSISFNDTSTANQLLSQIKQHSSQTGDATQRLAYFFGNALQARLNGTGSHIYKALSFNKNSSAADMMRAYQVYTKASPFEILAIIFANNIISNNTPKEAQTLHIIDYGIRYGFKWPAFINRISQRPGGPPKLRITGIDLPNSLQRAQETGRRLATYCNRFNVPFEFNAIAKRWESIKVEELQIRENEFVAVNCLFGFQNLLDETVVLENPRDAVLDLIHKANPNIFVHAIVNGGYDAPFFVTRFKEALFHYSALFDMLDNNIAGGDQEDEENRKMRLMFEEEFWGKEIMNVIACEGCERVERPETYRQWQVRHMRNGFRKMSIDPQVINKLKGRLRDDAYSKDFTLEVDGNWVLQGWKGKILYASSAWVPQ